MYKYKTLYLKNKARLPQVAEKIMEEDKDILEKLDDNPKDTTKEWQELYEEVDKPKQELKQKQTRIST